MEDEKKKNKAPDVPSPEAVMPHHVEAGPSAPPSYEEVMGINRSSVVEGQAELPPLAYIDIMPRFLTPGNMRNNQPPTFQKFSEITRGANMWLAANPGLYCWKCETVERKVEKGPVIDLESMKHHQGTYGLTVLVLGLRLWLTKKQDSSPPQQLNLIHVVPPVEEVTLRDQEYYEITGMRRTRSDVFVTFAGLTATLAHFNEELQKNPLQGWILNVETARLTCSGFAAARDPDNASYSEIGANDTALKRHCQIIRVFYVTGQPKQEQIYMQQFVPAILRHGGVVGSTVFEPFSNIIIQAQQWLQTQSGIRLVNIETRDVKVYESPIMDTRVNADSTDEFDGVSLSSKYVKVLRIFYVNAPEAPPYSHTLLTSRIFPPLRLSMRTFETMGQTMARIVAWLSVTRLPILSVETVHYPFVDNDNIGINVDRADYSIPRNTGKNWVRAIRLYFPTFYQEPHPQLLPPTYDWLTQGEGRGTNVCTIV